MDAQIPANWQLTTLLSIARTDGYGLVDGPFGSNLPASEYVPVGTPVIRGSNLTLGTSRFQDDGYVFVSDTTAKRLERSLCVPDDIVFTKKGTLGQVGLVPRTSKYKRFLISSNQMKLSVDTSLADPLFVYYYVSSPVSRDKIVRDSEQTGVPKTNLAYLRTFPILLPTLPEQRAIADILGTLDDKIELNRRMNETLEALARAIFKSWFVDFDPVRAKHALSEANGMEGRAPVGMDAETAALFPSEFEDSALGQIPKGWKVGVLNDFAEFVLGGDWGEDQPTKDTDIPALLIRGADIPSLQSAGTGKMPTRYLSESSLKKRSLQVGDLVVEISGGSPTQSTGRPVLVTQELLARLSCPLVCSNFCRMFRPKQPITSNFIYLWLRWLYLNDIFLQYENGTVGIKNFAFTIFSEGYQMISPPYEVLEKFDGEVRVLFSKMQLNGVESETLAALRDMLLPRLLSGEVRVGRGEASARQLPART